MEALEDCFRDILSIPHASFDVTSCFILLYNIHLSGVSGSFLANESFRRLLH